MARKITFDNNYIFIPSLNTITFGDPIPKERLLLITNLSTNTVIYNFSDPNLRYSSYNITQDLQTAISGGGEGSTSVNILTPGYTCTVGQEITGYGIPDKTYVASVGSGGAITLSAAMTAAPQGIYNIFGTVAVLNYNTASMSASSVLQIFVDEYKEKIAPEETFLDPVSKQRVSTPQSLIDTDFEYGTQPTKWETVQTVANRPTFYIDATNPVRARDITVSGSTRTVLVNLDQTAPIAAGAAAATITLVSGNTSITGTNTTFLSHLAPGSVLYTISGVPFASVATVTADTTLTLKTASAGAFSNQPYRFSGNVTFNPTTSGVSTLAVAGIYSPPGLIATTSGNATGTGSGAQGDFFKDINVGDQIYTFDGLFVGTVSGVTSSTQLIFGPQPAVRTLSAQSYVVSQFTPGRPFYITDTTDVTADGNWLIGQNASNNAPAYRLPQFTYEKSAVASGTAASSIFNVDYTYGYLGNFYTGSIIRLNNAAGAVTYSGATVPVVTVTTSGTHALTVGNQIYIANSTSTTNPPNGSWTVASIPTQNSFQFVSSAVPTGAISGVTLYPRPTGQIAHRPADGGVSFTTGTNSNNVEIIRQTRRFFRYQSGKGLQFSTGTIVRTPLRVDSVVSDGTIVTVTTKIAHNLLPGVQVTVYGASPATYNGTYVVESINLSDRTFSYTPTTAPSAGTATGFPITILVSTWVNASNRIGMFTRQNGMFFEYDGQNMYCVRRSATDRLAGNVTCVNGTGAITGVGTLFSSQLRKGDAVVIRGMVHKVENIYSDTSMDVTPEYRGSTLTAPSFANITKIVDYRVPQSQWNIDKCDGTGPSGFKLDLNRIQMLYIDYSWYGAGAARFGFKNQRGEVIYCHRIPHGNNKFEAYMRSGNLPSRYESSTHSLVAKLTSSFGASDTGIVVDDNSAFPTSGTVLVDNEYVTYTSKPNTTTFSGITRGQAGAIIQAVTTTLGSHRVTTPSGVSGIQVGQYIYGTNIPLNAFVVSSVASGSTNVIYLSDNATGSGTNNGYQAIPLGTTAVAHNITSTAPKFATFHSPRFAPTISHWGSSVIMDGRFDDDKSIVFTAGMNTPISVNQGQGVALLSLRVAPSVDNGRAGLIVGEREIINTMQLTLREIGLSAQGQFLIRMFLNANVGSGNWIPAGGSSLAQICYHTAGTAISSNIGEPIYSFYTNSAGGTNYTVTGQELTLVRDLGNSVLGGGYNNQVRGNQYPDGPDVLTVVATNIDTAAISRAIAARISWTEAQA